MMTLEQVVGSVKELAVLPSSYTKLSAALSAPGATADSIAAVVQTDPALTVRLLKHANSAAYSPARPVSSVAHATSMVGTATLRTLALGTGIVKMFRGIPENVLSMSSFWKHSVAVGTAAQLLATRTGVVAPPKAFLAGLLHDVGELVVCLKCPSEARQVLLETDQRREPSFAVEESVLGFTHAEVGGLLMQAWGLAEDEMVVAAFHHRPSEVDGPHRPLVDLVHVADVIVTSLKMGNAGERAAHPLDDDAWRRTGLRAADVQQLLPTLDKQVGSLAEALTS